MSDVPWLDDYLKKTFDDDGYYPQVATSEFGSGTYRILFQRGKVILSAYVAADRPGMFLDAVLYHRPYNEFNQTTPDIGDADESEFTNYYVLPYISYCQGLSGASRGNMLESYNSYFWDLGSVDGDHSMDDPRPDTTMAKYAIHIGSYVSVASYAKADWHYEQLTRHPEMAKPLVQYGLDVRPFIEEKKKDLEFLHDLQRVPNEALTKTVYEHMEDS